MEFHHNFDKTDGKTCYVKNYDEIPQNFPSKISFNFAKQVSQSVLTNIIENSVRLVKLP